tara:strand:+ start:1057 stop:1725 length:669 start_codon:yes stop_codon:yes gene_type:complete
MKILILIYILFTNSVFANNSEEDRYKIIVDRKPFGQELISPDPSILAIQAEANAIAAARSAEKELRLCFLFETTHGVIRAGFQNKVVKKGEPKSVMLAVGETFKGMKLIDVNINESTATLDRNGVKIMFSLAKAPKNPSINSKEPTGRKFNSGFRPQKSTETPKEKIKLTPQEEERRKQEIQESLRRYQMDVIRAGLPALPVPLTKEMDDQLVAEGVLPPEN